MAKRNGELRLNDVEAFLAVRRRGSINATARELQMDPSQVSKAVGRLEREVGLRLLHRTTRGVSVSPEAAPLLPHFEELIERVRLIRQREAEPGRELTLAGPSYLVSFAVQVAARALPSQRLRVLELAPSLVRAYATQGVFDVALSAGLDRPPPGWTCLKVGSLRLGLFAQPTLVLTLGRQPIAVERLAEIPFIGPTYHFEGRMVPVDDGCPLAVSQRRRGHEIHSILLALDLARRVPQVVFGPELAARPLVERGELAEIRVRGWSEAETLYLACNRDRVLARVQQALLGGLREELEAVSGHSA